MAFTETEKALVTAIVKAILRELEGYEVTKKGRADYMDRLLALTERRMDTLLASPPAPSKKTRNPRPVKNKRKQ